MHLTGLLNLLRDTTPYRELIARLRRGESAGDLGVLRAARPLLVAALARDWGAPVIYFTARIDRAYNASEQLPVWLGEQSIIDRFEEPAPFFYERAPWSDSSIRNRLETLNALTGNQPTQPFVVVASARALMQRTLPPHLFRSKTMTLATGQRHSIERLLSSWVGIGYEPSTIVVMPGTFSRRGGILDIYPIGSDAPVRVEFFDDEIDSLRRFDVTTQRSTERVERVVIPPAREALPEMTPAIAARLSDWFAQLPATDSDPISPQEDAESLAAGIAFPHLEHYLPFFYEDVYSLLDHAPDNALIITEDEDELRATIQEIEARAAHTREEKLGAHHLAPDYPQPHLSWAALERGLHSRLHVSLGSSPDDSSEAQPTVSFRSVLAPQMRFAGQLKMLLTQIRTMRSAGDRTIAVSAQAPRLVDLWHETDSAPVTQAVQIEQPPAPRSVMFVDGTLQEGWRLRTGDGDLHLLTDAEIFGWSRPEPQRRSTRHRARTPELSYSDLNEGDYVVHVDYGIGRFAGMRRRTLEGIEREYLAVEYAGTDALFVPIHQTDRLTRYIGADDRPPTLNKLGQPDWGRIKGKAKKAVEEEARELLALYASRANAIGHAYSVDTPWQAELEASFPFIETDDQLRAVRDVKADMERTYPMDRLICGDVGYGKTEVALRAAFKAVMDGRQVAILVPTTILAQQHYETFRRRMSPFPVAVEALSRFRSRAEQTQLIEKLSKSEVDIVIGTHRLLQNDVRFQNLGLVIIDEEQRFGVKHKEHLKALRTQVDVLTLTATPIPRTLYMGLTGVRDISMIQTPPEERLPIITHVGTFDERLVRQAVLREMERGGQVFVVHNRVQTINLLREKLERIVPEARIAIGHGQMDERLLENVMLAFGNGEYDILLATSIIESGLDIPNANTLIVDRADLFGMSQLYQLRGRVGRSAQQAYAYFFHPSVNRMTDDARMRLETLAEYVDLGSGFQIAMRDLELRGAGDILSTRQTGHIALIGFHLYTQMLSQAVHTLKGEQVERSAQTVSETAIMIDLPLPAYLPTDWIPEMGLRLQIYRRIGGLDSAKAVEAMRNELRDRFGELPAAVDGLLYQIEVKLAAQAANATAILQRTGRVEIRLPYLVEMNRDLLQLRLGQGIRVTRTAVEIATDSSVWRSRLLSVLEMLAEQWQIRAGL